MPIDILMPALSPTMTEGTLAKWHKKEGDSVAAGDVIAEIETDKATMEVEAVDEGKIGKILIAEGTAGVAVNTPIAVLLEEGESAGAVNKKPAPASAPPARHPEPQAKGLKSTPEPQRKDPSASPQDESKKGNRVFASPLAKRLAAEKGIDLNTVKGSGPHGRIVKADLEGAASKGPSPSRATRGPLPLPSGEGRGEGPDARKLADLLGQKYKAVPNNSIRKVVARRLLESKQTVPHFYLTVEYRIDALLAARAELNAAGKDKYKLSVNDFVIKAAAMALKAYPNANAAWTDDAILLYENADISVAVATPNGLMTPIVKAAETKGLVQISAEVKDLAKRARDGKLKPEEFQGGSFTVSNLGMFGVSSFGAIINPPQACILAVGAGIQKPYVEDGAVKIGTFMNCTLSVDHRAVDGAVGAEYLQILKQYIETPAAMLL
jgi:pyruvate dehydrogenase E2 component (dihydrolipoamide acetyltransferase)